MLLRSQWGRAICDRFAVKVSGRYPSDKRAARIGTRSGSLPACVFSLFF